VKERKEPLGTFGINGPEFGELIGGQGLLGLNAFELRGGRGVRGITPPVTRAGGLMRRRFGFGSGLVGRGGILEMRRREIDLEVKVVVDPEKHLRLGSTVVSERHRFGGGVIVTGLSVCSDPMGMNRSLVRFPPLLALTSAVSAYGGDSERRRLGFFFFLIVMNQKMSHHALLFICLFLLFFLVPLLTFLPHTSH